MKKILIVLTAFFLLQACKKASYCHVCSTQVDGYDVSTGSHFLVSKKDTSICNDSLRAIYISQMSGMTSVGHTQYTTSVSCD